MLLPVLLNIDLNSLCRIKSLILCYSLSFKLAKLLTSSQEFVANTIFVLGMKLYIKRLPESRFVLKDIFKVICNARKVKRDNPG